jgi:hypothetical protein
LIETFLQKVSTLGAVAETEDLLTNLSYDDEHRYIKNMPFEFLLLGNPKSRVTLKSLVRHLRNGLICDSLTLTGGPSALITRIVKSGKASPDFTRIFTEVQKLPIADPKRKFPSVLEDFLFRGIEEGHIVEWITEICECKEEVAEFYRTDATVRDPVRAQFLVNALRRQ